MKRDDKTPLSPNKQPHYQRSAQKAKSAPASKDKKHYYANARCLEGSKCTFICAQKSCQEDVLLCADEDCPCRIPHQNQNGECLLIEPEALVRKTERNILSDEIMVKYLKAQIQNIVDWISDFEERIDYLGLSQEEMEFLKHTYEAKFDLLTGGQIHHVAKNLNTLKRYIDIEETQWALEQTWFHAEKIIKSQFEKIPTIIHNNYTLEKSHYQSKLPKHHEIDSKIIQTEEELCTVKTFLPHTKSVSSFRLLYRATEHRFSIDKFFEKCSRIPNTIIVVQNEHNRKIGGFTPLEWTEDEPMYKPDYSGESCLFSITGGEKFQLLLHEYSMRSLTGLVSGPMFGMDQFAVRDKANTVKKSVGFGKGLNGAYGNGQFQGQNQEGILRELRLAFNGGEDKEFHIKEWQAYQVIFK